MSEGGKLDLEGIRARVEAATGPKWKVYDGQAIVTDDEREWVVATTRYTLPGVKEGERNAAFIAHAREDIPALLTALAQAEHLAAVRWQDVCDMQEQKDMAEARADAYREALEGLMSNPHGCRLCDYGMSRRRPEAAHDEDCEWVHARAALAGSGKEGAANG